ncbi:MAG: hypothetical protein ACI9L6_000227 [Flavobacterium sp.]|jgi:hypothetical protein
MGNKFTNKGITILYKKTDFNTGPKNLQLGFLSRKFSSNKIQTLNQKLKFYNINNTN